MRPRHPYRVRDLEMLKRYMAASQRVVPHSVRSLAVRVGVSRATIGDLLTGKQETVSVDLAQRLSGAFGVPVSDLFMSTASSERSKDATVSEQ